MPQNSNEQEQPDMVVPDNGHVLGDLDKNRKIALAVLAFFALLIMIFGVANIRSGIYGPFEKKSAVKTDTGNIAAYCPDGNCSEQSESDLKSKDTDGDGLSDYDELNVYKTSPYLEDSDSDGFLDKEEITNNKNPNCPTGKDCAENILINGEADLTNSGEANNIDLDELDEINKNRLEAIGSGTSSAATPIADMDAATLRQMLIEAGMEKALLDQISDKDLMDTFSETLKENEGD